MPKYKLYVKGHHNEEYTLWSERQNELRNIGLEGSVWLDDYSSYATVELTGADVEILRDYYASTTSEDVTIHFKTAAVVAGSTVMGPATPLENLAQADWSLSLVSKE